MLLDGNNMIELLSLPEWDDRILDMLEEFGEERPVYDPDDTTTFIKPEGYFLELMFEDDAMTSKQKEHAGEGNLYLNQIILSNKTTIKLPFDLEIGDDYDTVVKKLGTKENYTNEYMDNRLHWIREDNDKKYKININFADNKLLSLQKLSLIPVDELEL